MRHVWRRRRGKGWLCVAGEKGINWKTVNKAWEESMYLLSLVENLEVGGDDES